MSVLNVPVQNLGGTAEALAKVNPVLKARQIVIETDTSKMKVGDGFRAYNDLPYVKADAQAAPDGDIFGHLTELDLSKFPTDEELARFNAQTAKFTADSSALMEKHAKDLQDIVTEHSRTVSDTDCVKRPELTELDLSKFPTDEELKKFNDQTAEFTAGSEAAYNARVSELKSLITEHNEALREADYAAKSDLTELDLSPIIARIEALERKVGV